MKKTFNKIKSVLIAVWIALISFSSKAIGKMEEVVINPQIKYAEPEYWIEKFPAWYSMGQELYWTPSPIDTTDWKLIRIACYLLVLVVFVFWIISYLKIRKFDDKALKKKKIKNTVIVISILIILIIALSFSPLLIDCFS